jgi:maltose-binding protein MalE
MKKFALIAAASSMALALAACGDADDASEDAMADNVEMPADEAMASVPDPATDAVDDAAEEATQDAEAAIEQTAETAADAAEATVADIEAAQAPEEPAN